jgi:hypothetical protein
MRVDPLPSFVAGLSPSGQFPSAGDIPFGAMFQQASKDTAGVRMTEQEDGTFLMSLAEEVHDDKSDADQKMSELSLETQFLQAFANGPSVATVLPDMSVAVLQEIRSFLGFPATAPQDAPLAMRVRFEKSAQGVVVVIQLQGEALLEKAQQQKSVLQTRLSEVLDRQVTVRFARLGEFDQIVETVSSHPGFQQGQQQGQHDRPSSQGVFQEDESEWDGDV